MSIAPMLIATPNRVRQLRNTTFAVCALALVFVAGCAASAAEVKRAKNSGYDADFATVYGETLAAVIDLYPRTVENAVTGLVQTAWHVVAVQTGSGQDTNPRGSTLASAQPSASSNTLGGTSPSDRKSYFIRFRVLVTGGKPWRIRIEGEASEWGAGDVPMPLKGAEVPPWLKGRVDALYIAIYKRLKKYAVKIEQEVPLAEGRVVSVKEPGSFGSIPADAQEFIAGVHRAITMRDLEALRQAMANDMQWSVGDPGDAELAIALWQADPTMLDDLSNTLDQGCAAGDGALIVSCPRAYSEQANYSGHRVIFEKRGGHWLMTAFVSGN